MSRRAKTLRRLTRILVPSDFSESSAAAVDYAHALGKTFGARIDVLQIRGRHEFAELCSTILRAAASDDADLIVVGLHRTTLFSHTHTGDEVARRLAQHATCPVITVRASMKPVNEASGFTLLEANRASSLLGDSP